MKTLLLLRHAKSTWDNSDLADHDRPLKRRGVKAACRVGRLLKQESLQPDAILCSTAVRAKQTLELLLEESGMKPPVEFLGRLYHCEPAVFATCLQHLSDDVQTAMLIGHNPGLEAFLCQLVGQPELFPTAALARIELPITHWSEFNSSTQVASIQIWRPKELEE